MKNQGLLLRNTVFLASQNHEESVQYKNQGEQEQLPHTGSLRNSLLRLSTSASNVDAIEMGLVPTVKVWVGRIGWAVTLPN